jgi:hypothetical protein
MIGLVLCCVHDQAVRVQSASGSYLEGRIETGQAGISSRTLAPAQHGQTPRPAYIRHAR